MNRALHTHLSSLRLGSPGGPYAVPVVMSMMRFTATGVPQSLLMEDWTVLWTVVTCAGDVRNPAIAVAISIGTTPGGTDVFDGNTQVNELKNVAYQFEPGDMVWVKCNNTATPETPVNLWVMYGR